MSYLAHIAERVIGRPLLITPQKAEIIFDVLAGRIVPEALVTAEDAAQALAPNALRDSAKRDPWTGQRMKTYETVGGVAHIPIVGSLVNRGAYVGASSGLVSYEGLHTQISEAVGDTGVKAILLDINSPGGEVGGMFSLAAAVRSAAQQKPVVAFVNDMAASAAYGLASQASQIVVSPSSVVGSIGVVLVHLDRSGEMAAKGIKPTVIHAGAHKVDGNPFGPLPDGVRANLQAEVDKIYGLFIETVAEGRGRKLSARAARATEAQVFRGQDAIDRGLADVMASFSEVMSSLQQGRKIATSAQAKGTGRKMSTNTDAELAATTPAINININGAAPAASVEANPVAAATPVAAAPDQAASAGPAVDQKARIKAITTCEASKGREDLAQHLAFDTDMSAEAAVAILEKSPKAAVSPQAAAQAYVDQKAAHGALGLAPLASAAIPEAEKVKAGWGNAVNKANAARGLA